jgi:hypothetical protein
MEQNSSRRKISPDRLLIALNLSSMIVHIPDRGKAVRNKFLPGQDGDDSDHGTHRLTMFLHGEYDDGM